LTLLRWRKSKLGRSCGKRVAIIWDNFPFIYDLASIFYLINFLHSFSFCLYVLYA
jgi:hypothetical protein